MTKGKGQKNMTGMEVAVIGMAGRFPGAKNIHEFWNNLKNGVEAISFFSGQELEKFGVTPDIYNTPNFIDAEGILEDTGYFDSSFFGYTPKEAELMHPQIRIFHECVWHALEDAGYDPESYKKPIGLYAGASTSFDWEALSAISGRSIAFGAFAAGLLTNKDLLCNRVSYKLNLKGPTLFIQTTCSTSLAAIHLACRALLTGECKMALAGGITVSTSPKQGYIHEEGMIMSPDGHCRAFDARAKGTVGGNGAGVVLLKPLKDAAADGDYIYGVVKSSAINNDGIRKVGYTAPSVEGQAEVIRTALRLARVEPETIGYIETHGTGTTLGDPVEIEALKLAFKTDKKGFCSIGAIKANMGHLDCAAGAAGFIKTVLALKHKQIPPGIHYEAPNPKIDFENSPFFVNTRLLEWQDAVYPRRAGVSSFGIGGTNAHVVLEEAGEAGDRGQGAEGRERQLILLSAKTMDALDRAVKNLAEYFEKNPGISLADAAYTLTVGRKAFRHRAMAVCNDIREAVDALSPSAQQPGKLQRFTVKKENGPVVFMFPGQGAQYVDMGKELYEKEPSFREEMDRCFKILEPLMGYNPKGILYPPAADNEPVHLRQEINRTEATQPVIFVFEYALAKMLMARGIKPAVMIGHSIGEYTAACLAGVFSLEDALRLVALRGKMMGQMPTGAMMGVFLPEEELTPLLEGDISLAAVNSSSRCVISGPQKKVDIMERKLRDMDVQCTRLHTSHAFHSAMMDPILTEFEEEVRRVALNKPAIPYISNVTGNRVTDREASDPAYWAKHVRAAVRFADGMAELLKKQNTVFVEIGPGNVLSTFARQHKDKREDHHIVNLIRHPKDKVPDVDYMLTQIGRLWLYGVNIEWRDFYSPDKRYRIPLPPYPFEHLSYVAEGDPFKIANEMLSSSQTHRSKLTKNKNIAEWFYIPSWQRFSPAAAKRWRMKTPGGTDSTDCLVFLKGGRLSGLLKDQLEKNGQRVTVVKAGREFAREDQRLFRVNPREEEDYSRLFRALRDSGQVPSTIVHLWNVTGEESAPLSVEAVKEALDNGFYSLLNIARAIGKQRIIDKIRLEVVTDHLQAVIGSERLHPLKAPLLGAVKTIPLEYANITCRAIDIDGDASPSAEQLAAECLAEPGARDMVTALRGNYRWVRTFEPVHLEKSEGVSPLLREKGVYLVTGGLGGIGLTLAQHLAGQVKARLVLVVRSPFPAGDEKQELKIRELEAMGAEVMIAAADVADEKRMRSVIVEAEGRFGQVHGIIHGAGIADYGGIIQKRSKEASARVLAAKVTGTLVLETIFKENRRHLDFFILCSSLASVLAPPGQVAYNAANVFLDAFAFYKTSLDGTFTVSVNWDAWQQVGMAVKALEKAKKDGDLLKHGILPSEGREVFNRILDFYQPQVAVSARDLGVMTEQAAATADREPLPAEAVPPDAGASPQRPQLSVEYAAPRDELEQKLAAVWQKHFGFKQIGIHDDFFELGGDSLLGMRLVNTYKELLGEIVHVTAVFDAPTIAQSAEYFKKNYPEATAGLFNTGGGAARAAVKSGEKVTSHRIARLRKLIPALPPYPDKITRKNPPIIFILSPPRSGTTLLRVMLAGHPKLFAPPELVLLSAENLAENRGGHQSSIRAIMEIKQCSVEEAAAMMQSFEEQKITSKEFYRQLQEWLGERILVDKSPNYTLDPEVLRRAELYFENPLYIHLLRHPYGMIRSFEEAKLDLLAGGGLLEKLSLSRRQLAEMSWTISHQNILAFFKGIPRERRYRLKFEDLTADPQTAVEDLCRFLGLDPHPDMLRPYKEKKQRMTDGIHDEGMMVGDVKFHRHKGIEAKVAETWKQHYTVDFMGDDTRRIAGSFGYEPIEKNVYSSINAVEKKEYYPLSSAQKRLYFIQQMEPGLTSYNVTQAMTMAKAVDKKRMENTFSKLIKRHESLRTAFEILDGQPMQRIYDDDRVAFAIELYDAAGAGEDGERQVVKKFVRPFNLARPPLLRAGLINKGKDRYILMVDTHHIAADGISQRMLTREFLALYAGEQLLPLRLYYKDYSEWWNGQRERGVIKKQEAYWLKEFEGEIPVLNLPIDYPRPEILRFEGDSIRVTVAQEEAAALKEMALAHGATLYMVLLALYVVFLGKVCRQENIVVGTPMAGRKHADLDRVIGMFVDVLVMYNFPGAAKTFEAFLAEVKEKTLKAYENQDYPFEELVARLSTGRIEGRNHIVETHFVFQNAESENIHADHWKGMDDFESTPYEFDRKNTKLDISMIATGTGKTIICDIQYSTLLFKKETIKKFSGYFVNIVKAVVKNSQILLGEIDLLSDEEKDKIAADTRDGNLIADKLKGVDFNEIF